MLARSFVFTDSLNLSQSCYCFLLPFWCFSCIVNFYLEFFVNCKVHVIVLISFQLMVGGVPGATGARVQSPAAKDYNTGVDSVTVQARPMVAKCAWDRQIKPCHVTKATVQVC